MLEGIYMPSFVSLKGTAGAVFAQLLILSLVISSRRSQADETAASAPAATSPQAGAPLGKTPPAPPKLPEPKGAQRLSKDYPIWIDPKEKTVIVEGQVALREG